MDQEVRDFLGVCADCPDYTTKDSRFTMVPWCNEADEMLHMEDAGIVQSEGCSRKECHNG